MNKAQGDEGNKPKFGFTCVKDNNYPNKDGRYICAIRWRNKIEYDIYYFANDLYNVDKFDFADKRGKKGFYNYDHEWGFSEVKVDAWCELPKLKVKDLV